jgi:hypothetical protein
MCRNQATNHETPEMPRQGSYGPWNSWNILEKKADPELVNNPEISLISRQYSANPWDVLELYKS